MRVLCADVRRQKAVLVDPCVDERLGAVGPSSSLAHNHCLCHAARFIFAQNAIELVFDDAVPPLLALNTSALAVTTSTGRNITLPQAPMETCASSPSAIKLTLPASAHQAMVDVLVELGPQAGAQFSSLLVHARAVSLDGLALLPATDLSVPLELDGPCIVCM